MSENAPQEFAIPNAGIVIAAIYIPMLFDRLNVVDNHQKTIVDPIKAVQALNYLCNGSTDKLDLLPLLNVICNRFPDDPTPTDSVLSDDEKTTIDALIQMIIVSWEGIGNSSIPQFRGNWLVRSGRLISESNGEWSLVVETRPYDILLQQAPFNFSVVQLPWMERSITVSWNFNA